MPGKAYRSKSQVLQACHRLLSLWPSRKALRLQPSGQPTTPSLLRPFSQPCTSQSPLQIVPNPVLKAVGILLFGVPSPKALMCPEQIAAEGISFLDLCQTTFYLIPGVLLCQRGCGYDPENRQTHRSETDWESP